MVNVLKYLVNLGINGTDMPSTGSLNVSKIGNLVENNQYYYQDYTVNSKINLESYNIENISNFPEGTFVANQQNNPQTVFKNGESFRILLPKDKLDSDINGNILISSKVKNYPIFYGEAPSGKQDYIITYDTYGEEKINTSFNLKTNTGSLILSKKDSENGSSLSGIKFELVRDKTLEKYEGITNENGIIQFSNLRQGKYILREIETNGNYILNESPFEVNIEYNKVVHLDITNEIKSGQIKIIKTDKDTNKFLEGVEFEIVNKNTNEVVEKIVTDEKGEAISQKLRVDNEYYIREVKTNEKYNLDETPIDITIEYDKINEIELQNEIKKGKVKIIKIDKDTGEILEGVEFEIVKKDTNEIVEKLVTNESGVAISKDLRLDEQYYLRESKEKAGYEVNDRVYDLNLEDGKIIEIKVENEKIFIPVEEEPEVEIPEIKKEEVIVPVAKVELPKKLPKTGK